MSKYEPGTKILAYGKSLHAGQTGTVVADWGYYLLVRADDESYSAAYKSSRLPEGKYFQVDSLCVKQVKD